MGSLLMHSAVCTDLSYEIRNLKKLVSPDHSFPKKLVVDDAIPGGSESAEDLVTDSVCPGIRTATA